MNSLYLIFASQDFERANHRPLWEKIAELADGDVVVVDIPADYPVCLLRKKKYRLIEAKAGIRQVENNLYVVRPQLFLRPECLPKVFYKYVARQIWETLAKRYECLNKEKINIIVYNAYWVRVLQKTQPFLKISYYLFDEVQYNAADNSLDRKRYNEDVFACKHSEYIFTMTQVLMESRKKYNEHIEVIGNGADFQNNKVHAVMKFPRSVGFIGNFRDWIDQPLLEELIKKRTDLLFGFVGPVEDNMRAYLNKILDTYINTFYCGCQSKENIKQVYTMFDCVLIPYKQNNFIQASRPIKIVEAVFAGVPVVTTPVNGYQENSFIRFAHTPEEFSDEIDYVLENPILLDSDEYIRFSENNSWQSIASRILQVLQ